MSSTYTISSDHPIRRLYEKTLIAWNQRDAAAMAAHFEKDGNLIRYDGTQADSCAAIEDHLRSIFADHPTAATLQRCARCGFPAVIWGSFARLSG
jgi:uncharacterized protein (TIGR02246 family)